MSITTDETNVLREWGDDELGAGNGRSGQALCEQVIGIVRAQPNIASICDLGCGNGYLASRLGALGYSVTGIDGSDRLLAIAMAHYRSERVEFRQGFLGPEATERLTDRGRVDLVVSVDVVEHLYRPASLIETAEAILKPGGTLVLCTPYHGYLKNLAIAALGRWDDHHHVHFNGGHIKFFSVPTLKALIGPGFDVQDVQFYGRFPGLWKNMIAVARKRGG